MYAMRLQQGRRRTVARWTEAAPGTAEKCAAGGGRKGAVRERQALT